MPGKLIDPVQVWYLEWLACKLHELQVVSATNIIGAGHGLEVGKKLELLGIRQAEAHAEHAQRLKTAHLIKMQQVTGAQGLLSQTVLTTQVCTNFGKGSLPISLAKVLLLCHIIA